MSDESEFNKMFGTSGTSSPPGEIDTAAIQLHEMFSSFRRAGFSRREALYLVAKVLVGYGPDTEEK